MPKAIDAGPTGALLISAAPLGSAADPSAQTGGIRIGTVGGRAVRIDLGTGKVGGG